MPTKIEWTDEVWNPVTGCTPVSDGCANCYAKRMAKRFPVIHGYDTMPDLDYGGLESEPRPFDRLVMHPDRLDIPLHWKKPRRIFVCSMGDLFHELVPDEFIAAVFGVMAACPQHTFQVLTKRSKRMRKWFAWLDRQAEKTAKLNAEKSLPLWRLHVVVSCARKYGAEVYGARVTWPLPNAWIMVTTENQKTADIRIPDLLKTPAAVRGVSCEPLLGHIIFKREWMSKIDWVIAGCESGPHRRHTTPQTFAVLMQQCKLTNTPFFLKQAEVNGKIVKMPYLDGRKWDQYPTVERRRP